MGRGKQRPYEDPIESRATSSRALGMRGGQGRGKQRPYAMKAWHFSEQMNSSYRWSLPPARYPLG